MRRVLKMLSKIRLIDLLVAALAISAITVALLTFTRKQETVLVDLTAFPQDWNLEPFPPSFQLTDAIQVGDAAYNWSGKKIIEITDVERTAWEGNRKAIRITARLNVVYDPRLHQYTFNDTPILIGNKLTLNTQKATFDGQVVNVYRNETDRYRNFEKKKATVTVYVRDIEEWHAEALRTLEAKNSKGETIAKTIQSTVTPAQMDAETDRGTVMRGYSTITKDAEITLELSHVYCSEGTCYFNNLMPLKTGARFWVQSEKTFIEQGSVKSVVIH